MSLLKDMDDNEQIKRGIICRFENPFFTLRYDIANMMQGDTGGLSITWANLARRTEKNLVYKLFDLYTKQPHASHRLQAERYLPLLADKNNDFAERDEGLHTFIQERGRSDETWQACCDTIIDEELGIASDIFFSTLYYDNDASSETRAFMEKLGLWNKTTPWDTDIPHLLAMDGIIQGGYHKVIWRMFDAMRKRGERRFEDYREALDAHFDDPIKAQDLLGEKTFCEAYCVVRHKWLRNLSAGDGNPAAAKTVYRMEAILDLIRRDEFDFYYGMKFKIFDEEHTITKGLLGL